ncbi:MAG: rhodanese-related sulfurtransferase [Acidobacteria bacterium]|nr:rhodanese-related sulfurtransferase [Acidobacteriota bacterium]
MELQKVILYYGFTPLADPEAVMLWQRTLCESLNLKGRILLSSHGINGTLGGDMSALKRYIRQTKLYPGFKGVDFKWSDGTGDDFPRLRVRVRDEIVSFGAPGELVVDHNGVVGGGVHLKPEEVHQLVDERGDEVVFFDGRNAFEAKIGRFKNAIVPDVNTTRDFVSELESGKYDHLKDRPIVTYCTGGIRCEVLSSVMKRRGFQEVYQVEGGIVRYGERFGDKGLWEGSLYIFDARMNHEFSEHAATIGECERCAAPTSKYYNCANLACRKLILLCEPCTADNVSRNCAPSHVDAI